MFLVVAQYTPRSHLLPGFLPIYENMSNEDLEIIMSKPEYHYPGLEGCKGSLEWLWDTGFAAVAADSPGFEAWCESRLICTRLAVAVLIIF